MNDSYESYSTWSEEIASDLWDMTLIQARKELDGSNVFSLVDDIHHLLYEKRIKDEIDNALSAEVDRQIDEYKENKYGTSESNCSVG